MNDKRHKIGCLRTSAQDKNPDTQEEALQQAGCDPTNIIEGATIEPFVTPAARRQLLDLLSNGGELIVSRLDRLSRDEHTLTHLVRQLEANGIALHLADQAEGDGHEQ